MLLKRSFSVTVLRTLYASTDMQVVVQVFADASKVVHLPKNWFGLEFLSIDNSANILDYR